MGKESIAYSIHNSLYAVGRCKNLGVIITSDLIWDQHISVIEKKAMRELGYLRRPLRIPTWKIWLITYTKLSLHVPSNIPISRDPYTQTSNNKLKNSKKVVIGFFITATVGMHQ